MLVYWLLLVLFIGKLAGGQLKNLAWFKLWGAGWLPVVILVQLSGLLLRHALPWLAVALLIGSYSALLFIGWFNRRLPGMALLLFGIALNFLVITSNGGTMPITPEALEAIGRTHQIETLPGDEATSKLVANSKDSVKTDANLVFLGDVIIVPLPGRLASAISVGDLFIGVGSTWLGLWALRVPFLAKLRYRPDCKSLTTTKNEERQRT